MQHEIDETLVTMGRDFWPYGMEANRTVLEAACRYAQHQGLCDRRVEIEELFAENLVALPANRLL
jgi:4,5-dihydroxyphthalate decarboxylase